MPNITAGKNITDAAQLAAGVVASSEILDDSIVNTDINSAAAIARTKLADITTTSRVIGRKTAGAGADEEISLTELLDFIGSATKGDVLVRDTSAWARLAAGTSGYFLTANGAGALPSYQQFGGIVYKNGTATKDVSEANADQVIAHGLGTTPKKLRIFAMIPSTIYAMSYGIYNGTTISTIDCGGTAAYGVSVSSTKIINLEALAGNSANLSQATLAIDATNITLSWVKTNTPTGIAKFVWEVEA